MLQQRSFSVLDHNQGWELFFRQVGLNFVRINVPVLNRGNFFFASIPMASSSIFLWYNRQSLPTIFRSRCNHRMCEKVRHLRSRQALRYISFCYFYAKGKIKGKICSDENYIFGHHRIAWFWLPATDSWIEQTEFCNLHECLLLCFFIVELCTVLL